MSSKLVNGRRLDLLRADPAIAPDGGGTYGGLTIGGLTIEAIIRR
jgi:hypothetical protein